MKRPAPDDMDAAWAIFRASTIHAGRALGRGVGPNDAATVDVLATETFRDALVLMAALAGDDGDAVAREYGWPSAAALSAFLHIGTVAGSGAALH